MKYLYLFLLPLLFIASCKKDDPNTDDNGNPQNNQPDTRTGLERLTNKDAENYCVMVVGNDTAIWQSTANDSIQTWGGLKLEFPASYYFYNTSTYCNVQANSKIRKFTIEFERATDFNHYHNNIADCNTTDSVILKGNHTPDDTMIAGTKYRFYISMQDSTGSWAVTRLANGAFINITSITDVPNGTDCKKVRIKGSISNVTYTYNDICGPVPVFTIQEGVFQMDFKWPG
jgi:hypothetical protein